MKLYKTIFFIVTFLVISCSLAANTDGTNNKNDSRDIPLGLFYGMEFDEDHSVFIDSLFDSIPELRHYEFDKKWYYSGGETNNISFHAQLGIYIDTIIPEPIWSNIQPIINNEFATLISYDAPLDSIFSNEIAELVKTPTDYAKKWEILMDKFSKTMSPTIADSAYFEIVPLRVCGVVHKIFEDEEWETYLVEFSYSNHGGSGCTSYADYITFNKYDGHQLTEEEVFNSYNKSKLQSELETKFNEEKTKRGYDPTGDSTLCENKSGIAYIQNGILIYFHPYVVGCGAEEQYNIILNTPF